MLVLPEVRAIWSEDEQKCFYSVLDIIDAFNMQDDYEKNRNYWKYLKTKLKKENSELVSATNQLKLKTADGKRYNTDVIDMDTVRLLAGALTDEISSREIFMKGIDYSYYYCFFMLYR